METEKADRWEIDQDDFGHPLVRHRHMTATVPAYVSKDAQGRRQARCPDCGEQIEVPGRPRDV
jgi:hypothetical protein